MPGQATGAPTPPRSKCLGRPAVARCAHTHPPQATPALRLGQDDRAQGLIVKDLVELVMLRSEPRGIDADLEIDLQGLGSSLFVLKDSDLGFESQAPHKGGLKRLNAGR